MLCLRHPSIGTPLGFAGQDCVVGRSIRLHSHLHAGVLIDRRGDEWVAGGFDDFPRISTKAPPSLWSEFYNYAWFISFGISFTVYVAMTFACRDSRISPALMTISENKT